MGSRALLASLVSLGVVAALGHGVARAQLVSPGHLARSHAELDTVEGCPRCHSSGDAVSDALCLRCHRELSTRIRAGTGYHARRDVRARACEECHIEHRGPGASIVRWPGGAADRFDHAALTGYRLEGAHARARCNGCHRPSMLHAPDVRRMSAAARSHTYLGLDRACGSCHRDVHTPSLGARCETCHGVDRWQTASAGFDHSRTRYPLRGAHVPVACVRCHRNATPGHPASYRGIPFALCTDCHRDPHAAQMGPPAQCTRCHTEVAWARTTFAGSSHAPQSFPLTGGHASPPCTTCHGRLLAERVQTACVTCHDDAHRPSLGMRCETCHQTTAWIRGGAPARGTGFHDRTAFPLHGAHASVECAHCHDPRVPAARRFRPVAHDRCDRCHDDPHHGELASRTDHGACDACHDESAFLPARFELADHARTRFALEGAHAAEPCTGCHALPPAAPGFHREDRRCEACHTNPHGDQFAGRPAAANGCEGCHDERAFAPSRFDRAAHARAGFALEGRHDTACAQCHTAAAAGAPVRYVGVSMECGACHRDIHAGQFGSAACSTCHAGVSFRPAVGFDHGITRFALRGQHTAVECGECHRRITVAAGWRTTAYRLGPRACVDCHARVHGSVEADHGTRPFTLARTTGDCEECHSERGWATIGHDVAFNHALTGVPLVGAHERIACPSCHEGARAGARMERCQTCHRDRHGGRLGDDCARCHSARSWTPDATLADHTRTRFPLLGVHAVQGCDVCHQQASRGDFRGSSAACESCHRDTPRLRHAHPPHESAAFTRCGLCHTQLAWRPSFFDHNAFWPLTGRHTSVACAACHTSGRYAGTLTACVSCHEAELLRASATIDHSGFPMPRSCEACHDTTGWRPARFPDHDRFFPLRGPHGGQLCTTCHTEAGAFALFTCFQCHEHERGRTDAQHDGVRDYTSASYDSAACYRCHPNGTH